MNLARKTPTYASSVKYDARRPAPFRAEERVPSAEESPLPPPQGARTGRSTTGSRIGQPLHSPAAFQILTRRLETVAISTTSRPRHRRRVRHADTDRQAARCNANCCGHLLTDRIPTRRPSRPSRGQDLARSWDLLTQMGGEQAPEWQAACAAGLAPRCVSAASATSASVGTRGRINWDREPGSPGRRGTGSRTGRRPWR